MVGEVIQVWRPRELNTHETEWGFSCMSYEISGALGIKMANPDKEVISFVGDGSYLLNNTDIYSSVITKNKLIIIVCDNGGFAVINKWVEGSSFWDSPTLEIPTTKENEEALKLYKEGKNKQRQGI